MARERDHKRRRQDPLVGGISDGVAAGYQAVEYVIEGLNESFSRRTSGGAPRRRRSQRRGAPIDLVDELADLFAQLLEQAADVAQETARAITEGRWLPGHHEHGELYLEAAPGKQDEVDFVFTNTGDRRLSDVKVQATEFIGESKRIPAKVLSFDPVVVNRLQPGREAKVKVTVKVPTGTAPGSYESLVQAEPGDASAVLELRVLEPAPATRRARTPRAATKTATAKKPQRSRTRAATKPSGASGTRRRTGRS